ncbi:MAG: LamG-like jellyroll fold domain-containing protein [Candidatus Scalinduaceae bacterium]
MHGALRTPTFVRLSTEPKAGDTTLILEKAASGWQSGDRIILPGTRQGSASSTATFFKEWEELTVQAISGQTITLTTPLAFDHLGARDGDDILEFLPHVGNLTRNITIRSENPQGTRGHTLIGNRSTVDIRYVQFKDLGRTTNNPVDNTTFDSNGNVTHIGSNQNMRFAFHTHHLYGPVSSPANGFQFTVVGNAIDGGSQDNPFAWGMTIHDSHYGLISQNVVYNIFGVGIATVDASETKNVFEKNFVVRVHGSGSRGTPRQGTAFWFRGPNNYVRDNVAANVTANYGYNIYVGQNAAPLGGTVNIPNFQGADTTVKAEYTAKSPHSIPILEFAGNEVYGSRRGFTIWYLNSWGNQAQNAGESVVKDFRLWHIYQYGFYGYPMSNVTFDGFVARGDKSFLSNLHEFALGMWFGDYLGQDIIIRNADIQGYSTGIIDPYYGGSATRGSTTTIIEDSYLRNRVNISVRTLGAPGNGPDGKQRLPKKLIIRNVKFGLITGWKLGSTPYNISMDYSSQNGSANLIQRDEVFVEDYNGILNNNFQVFYKQQHPSFIVPLSGGNLVGSPEGGLTNQENWEKYGIAIAGAVAPCTDDTAHPEINGFTCLTTPPPPPDDTAPGIPQGLNASAVSESRIDITWQAADDPESGISKYTIYRDGVNVGQSITTSFSDTGLSEGTTYTYEVLAVNGAGLKSARSASVSATTLADTTPPTITSVSASGNATEVTVVFSKPVEQTSAEDASNYSIDNGIIVSGASLGSDLKTVTLTTSLHSEGITYTVTVNNIQDRASTPNVIATNTQATYTFLPRVGDGLVALYDFNEGTGSLIKDISGITPVVDLSVQSGAVNWLTGRNGIEITSSSIIKSIDASKLYNRIMAANQLSMEAWVTPLNMTQGGPARIVTLSNGTSDSQLNAHLGQSDTRASFRTHTSVTGWDQLTVPGAFLDTTSPRHIVVTFDGQNKHVYFDGQLQSTTVAVAGDFSTWNTSWPLILGNENSANRPWLGKIYLVAIYDKALTAQEVTLNYNAGRSESPPPPLLTMPLNSIL